MTWTQPDYVKELRASGFIGPVSLTRLIEACGDPFAQLQYRDISGQRDWLADAWQFNRGGFSGVGSTPAEAVANLWLALNKN